MWESKSTRKGVVRPLVWAGVVAAVAGHSSAASAYSYNFSDGTLFNVHLTTTYTVGVRAESPSDEVVNSGIDPATFLPKTINYDDPDQNFDRGDLITNSLTAFLEAELTQGEFGFKASGLAFYDNVYHRDNANDSPGTVNKYGPNDEFANGTRYINGGTRFKAYDLFAYGTFHPFDTDLSVRAGNQVVAWGESLFFGNISLAQGPVDSTKGNYPGAEVKDILLPVPQISVNWGLNDRISLVGYYQFDYAPNVLDGVGSYFSRSDVVGPGAAFSYSSAFTPIVTKGEDIRPHNQGQFGVGTTFAISEDTSGGLYFINYHDKNPLPKFDIGSTLIPIPFPPFVAPIPVPVTYHEAYAKNIKLYGASLSTRIYDANVAAEISYREGAATLVATNVPVFGTPSTVPQPTTLDMLQANLSAIYATGSSPIWETLNLTGEVTYNQVTHIDPFVQSSYLFFPFPSPDASYSELYRRDKKSVGVQLQAELGYTDVFPGGWDLTVPINFGAAVQGTPAYNGALGAYTGEGDTRLGVGVKLRYLNNLELSATYAVFFGDYDSIERPLVDRDFAFMSVKYTF